MYHKLKCIKANVNLALKTPASLNSIAFDFYHLRSAFHTARKFALQMPAMQERKAGLRRVALTVETLSIGLYKKVIE